MSNPNKPPRYPFNNADEKAKRIVKKYQKTRSLLINTILKNTDAAFTFPDHNNEVLCMKPTVGEFGESLGKGGAEKVGESSGKGVVENERGPDMMLELEPFCAPPTNNFVMPTVGPFAAPSLAAKSGKWPNDEVPKVDLRGIPVAEDLMSVPVDINLDVADPPVTNEGYTNFSVVVRSLRPGDVGVMYNIHSNETFEKIYCDYADKVDVSPKEIRLLKWKDDQSILRYNKPKDVNLKTGDVMYVIGKPHVLNLATRIKVFYITEVARDPIKVKVSGGSDTLLVSLFHKWAEAANVDPSKVIFIHERKSLATVETIGGAKIENGDEIVAVVLNV